MKELVEGIEWKDSIIQCLGSQIAAVELRKCAATLPIAKKLDSLPKQKIPAYSENCSRFKEESVES